MLAGRPVGAQAERGTATDVGYFAVGQEKGGALISWATGDWLLGDGDVCGLVGKAVDLCGGKRRK